MNNSNFIEFENGDLMRYEGIEINGYISGKCIYAFASGAVYIGDIRNNMKHGYGREIYPNKDFYKGEFSNNLHHGYGVYTCSNGDRYEGQFQNDLFEGKGIYSKQSGEIFEGLFHNNEIENQREIFFPPRLVFNATKLNKSTCVFIFSLALISLFSLM